MSKAAGVSLSILGSIMFIPPQANLGLQQLRWMSKYSFPGEIVVAIVVLGFGLYLYSVEQVKSSV